MFIRGPHPEAIIWRHFRAEGDGFVFAERGAVCEAHILANADRVVELFLALAEHLPPAVQLAVDDVRTGERWHGEALALVEVRDAVARLKGVISFHAGVELTVFGPDDQLSITPNLDIFVFSRTDRWLYLLQGKGLRRVRALRPRSWRLTRGEFAPSAEITAALRATAERLALSADASLGSP